MPIAGNIYYFSHLEENRQSAPLVLIHGAGGNHLFFPPEMRRIQNRRIYAPDLPGHGKSKGVGRQFITDYVKDIIEFMNIAKLPKAVIAGHSMGGAIALELALKYPERVLGLIPISTAAKLRISNDILDNAMNPATLSNAVQKMNDLAFGSQADAALKELALKRMTEMRPAVLYGDFLACNQSDLSGKIKDIKTPTLIICGTEDKITPMESSEQLASQIRGAQLQGIEGAGHMLILEHPNMVGRYIEDFMPKIYYRPGEN